MEKKEYNEVKKEVNELLTDFGFVDPQNIVSQLQAIFNVEIGDINKTGLVRARTVYEVHYYDYIIELEIKNYELKIKDIKLYDDML